MSVIPTIITSAGAQPQSPASLRAQLIALVQAMSPGYTADLPLSLIEDITSTDVGAVMLCDQARVELINSLTPYGANLFLLTQLANIYGVTQGSTTNTSVFVIFTGPPGFVIPQYFVVGDGTNQYIIQDGGVIGTSGVSASLYAIASQPGSFVVPANTVNQLITSVPSTITPKPTVNNPIAGTPGNAVAESEASFRYRVLQAGRASAIGVPSFVKSQLEAVPGVQSRLVSVLQVNGGGWEILCGGGDPYAVAYAIFTSVLDVSTLVGSSLGITSATPTGGITSQTTITTNLNHGYSIGQTGINISGAIGMTGLNTNGPYTVENVTSQRVFTINYNSVGQPTYTGGGVLTPNPRNIVVSLQDYPNLYNVPYVNPPQQTVAIALTWNTNLPNFTNGAAFGPLAIPAMVSYINSITAGSPINLLELSFVVQKAVESVLPSQFLTRMVFAIEINGVTTSPVSGTNIINGDPESYFYTVSTSMTVTQG